MKISFLWGAGSDTGEAWSPLFPIEDPPSRSTQTYLEDLISDVKQGAHVLCLSPVALLETIGPFPRLHGTWCNSIFFLTAGKENQVIKCEKSPARGSLSAWTDFPTQLPSRKRQKQACGKTARLWTKAWHCPWMHCVPNTVCCQELTSQPCPAQVALLPIGLKRPASERLWSQRYALCSQPHCPRAAGPRWEASPPHQKMTMGGGTGGWKWAEGLGGGGPEHKASWSQEQPWSQWPCLSVLACQPFVALKPVFAPHLPLLQSMGHRNYGMHEILVLRSIYLGFAKNLWQNSNVIYVENKKSYHDALSIQLSH